jgi:Na+-driven multidrug efflux pump
MELKQKYRYNITEDAKMRIDEKHRREVLTGNLWKVVIFITAPLFLYQLINQFYNILDQMMVSTINSESVSAVATIAQIKNLLASVGSGLTAGGVIVVSRLYGAGELSKARKTANTLFTMALIVIGIIIFGFIPMSNTLLKLANVPTELIDISKTYFQLQLIEQVIMVINTLFIALERTKNNTKIIFVSNILLMSVKLILNVTFIYGFKVTNLAFVEISSLISQFTMMVIGCIYLFNKNNVFRLSFKELSLSWPIVKKIIIMAFPLFLGKFIMSLGKVTINAMCGVYGALTVGALGISNNLCGVVTTPCLTFEESTSAMVSQNLGSNNMKRCLKIFAVSSTYIAIWAIIGFLLIRVFFLDEIISLFNLKNNSLEFVNMIKDIFYYDCLTIPALAINTAILGILYGYGQTFLATFNNLLRIATRIGVLWYLQTYHPEIGWEAAGISMGISNIAIAIFAIIFLIIFLIKIKIKGYKNMKFSDPEPEFCEVDGILINKEFAYGKNNDEK